MSRRVIFTALAVLIALSASVTGAADPASRPGVAVLPMANYTTEPELTALFMPLVEAALRSHAATVVPAEELRPVLRRYRIRAVGAVDSEGARAIARARDISYLLIGSIDLYQDGEAPEAGISLRLLHAETMTIVWAASIAATGEDYVGMLDRGRITSIDSLAARLVNEAFLDFDLAFDSELPESPRQRTALIPFDNHEQSTRSGAVLTNYVLTALVGRGLPVCEPGDIAALLQRRRRVARGEIDLQRLGVLHDSLAVGVVVTGYVYQFQYGVASSESAMPHLEVDARLIDAASGRIVRSTAWERDGRDTEGIFGIGATRALGRLARSAADHLCKTLGYDNDPPTLGRR